MDIFRYLIREDQEEYSIAEWSKQALLTAQETMNTHCLVKEESTTCRLK